MSRDEKHSFWTTLPGVLTGILAAATLLVLVLVLMGDDTKSNGPGTTREDWARKANAICAKGYAEMRALDVPNDLRSKLLAIPKMTPIIRRGNARLRALDRPESEEDQERIGRLLAAASDGDAAYTKALAALRLHKTAIARDFLMKALRADARVQRLDRELGADVCAAGPRPVQGTSTH